MTLGKMATVVGLSLVAVAAHAQFFLPPDLPSKLKVVDVSEWEIKEVNEKYFALIKVSFINKSEYHLVFRESDFNLNIIEAERKVKVIGQFTPQNTIVYPADRSILGFNENVIEVGKVARPTEGEWGMFNEFKYAVGSEEVRYVLERGVPSKSEILRQEKEFELKAATKDGVAAAQEHMFVVNFKNKGVETRDMLLFKLFPLFMKRDANWSVIISGKTKIGIRNGDATIFSPTPIDFEVRGKPAFNVELTIAK